MERILGKTDIKLFLSFFITFSLFIHWVGWNEDSHYALTKAIVEESRFEINSYTNITGDRAFYNDNYYSDKSPGLSYFATPIYFEWKILHDNLFHIILSESSGETVGYLNETVGKSIFFYPTNLSFLDSTSMILLILSTSVLLSSLSVVLIYKLSQYFTNNKRYQIFVALIYGLGTLILPYSMVFMEHATAAFFILLSFYILLLSSKANNTKTLLISGIILAIASNVSIIIAFLFPMFILYTFYNHRKSSVYFIAGILIGILPFLLYNFVNFGSLFNFPQKFVDPLIWNISATERSNYGFTNLPNIFVMIRLLFFPFRGLFFYNPILLLSLIGLIHMFRKNKNESLLIIGLFIVLLLLFSARRIWYGGVSFGPRFFLPIVPFISLPLIFVFDYLKNEKFKILFFTLLLISIFFNLISLQNWGWSFPLPNELPEEYSRKVNSFEIIDSPLTNYYLLGFLKGETSSRLINGIINLKIPDIRDKFYISSNNIILSLLILSIVNIYIWNIKLSSKIKDYSILIFKNVTKTVLITKKIEWKIFLTFFIVFVIFIHWIGWNENSHFALTRAIVEERRFEINSYVNSTSDRSFYSNNYYSDKTPGLSILGVPIHSAWMFLYDVYLPSNFKENDVSINPTDIIIKGNVPITTYGKLSIFSLVSMYMLTVFTSSLFGSLSVVLVYKVSKYFSINNRAIILTTFIFGFATLIFHYSIVFMVHATTMFFSFLSYCLVIKAKEKRNIKISIVAGLFLGLGIIISEILLLFLPLFLVCIFLTDRKSLFLFVIGLFIGMLPLLIYNQLVFNSFFTLPRMFLDSQIWGSLPGYNGIGLPNLFIILRLLIFPEKGILFYHPIMLFSLLGFFYMYKKKTLDALLLLSIFLIFLLVNSSWWAWYGGASFGPRHLVNVIPFLILPLIYFIENYDKYNLLKKLFLISLFLSIFVNIIGLQPTEDIFISDNKVDIDTYYKQNFNSFTILANPLKDHYFNQFFNNGPRSPIIESLITGKLELRIPHLSKPKIPFLPIIISLLFIMIIWKPNTKTLFQKF